MFDGIKGSANAPFVVVQGAKALISKNWRHPTGGRLGDGVQGRAKSPLGHGGVGGAGTLRLTGDATAIRCTGFDDLRKRCPACIAGIWASGWRFGEAGLPEGMQRGTRSGCPLPRLRWYYHRHLADHANA